MIVTGECLFKGAVLGVVCMVIYNVHDNAYTVLVERHYQLLEFAYAAFRVSRIGGIRTLEAVVVLGIISPVVLSFLRVGFIYGSIVCHRQKMYVSYAKLLQMVKTGLRFSAARPAVCKSQKFSSVFRAYPGTFVNGDIPDMAFVYYRLTGIGTFRLGNIVPALRVCGIEVHYRTSVTVDTAGFCIDVYCFKTVVHILEFVGECIEKSVTASEKLNVPYAFVQHLHRQCFDAVVTFTVKIKVQVNSCSQR